MGDWTDGRDNYSSLAANFVLSQHASIMAGLMFPNGSGDARFSVHFVLCGP
jgi:hypothetical protein